jgi:outer membrane lipoprotein carrier protein
LNSLDLKLNKNLRMTLVVLGVLASLVVFPAQGFSQDEAEKALDLVRKTYDSISGLTATFVQVEERPGVGVTAREEGKLSFAPPDRMRWDYDGERPHHVVINASRVWIHTPSRKQIILRQVSPADMRKGAATFLGGLDGVEKDFTVQSRPIGPDESIPLDLFPVEDNLPYDKISLLVTPDSGLIERIAIHHKLGNTTTITFHGFKTDVKLPDKLFEWKVPEGTDVIEP